jgi:uncharacterized protein YdhG (YjbR/CyaY superfamily)
VSDHNVLLGMLGGTYNIRTDIIDSMQSTAKDVDTYINEASPERREVLTRLRDLCCTLLPGFEESMDYGGPCYKRNGEVEVGFANQKHFIGLYILRTDVMNAHGDLLKGKGVSLGKGIIRYPNQSGSTSAWWKACCAAQQNRWGLFADNLNITKILVNNTCGIPVL